MRGSSPSRTASASASSSPSPPSPRSTFSSTTASRRSRRVCTPWLILSQPCRAPTPDLRPFSLIHALILPDPRNSRRWRARRSEVDLISSLKLNLPCDLLYQTLFEAFALIERVDTCPSSRSLNTVYISTFISLRYTSPNQTILWVLCPEQSAELKPKHLGRLNTNFIRALHLSLTAERLISTAVSRNLLPLMLHPLGRPIDPPPPGWHARLALRPDEPLRALARRAALRLCL
eukprot:53789-Pleurochrysis_carterae.AAC.1